MVLTHSHKLDSILVEAIEEGLSTICNSAAQSVLFFLKNNGSIRSESNVESLEKFSEGLESIFGYGSKIIEKQILKALHMKLQLPPTEIPENFELVEEVDRAFKLCGTGQ